MKDNEYQCAICGGIFDKARSDEEAFQEAEKIWGKEMARDPDNVTVCEPCYKMINPALHPEERDAAIDDFLNKPNKTP